MTFDEDWHRLLSSRQWLIGRGYALAETRGPEGMESGLDRYDGRHLSIRIVADRGQWFVGIQSTRTDAGWQSLESWSACLGEPALFHVSRSSESDEAWATAMADSWHLSPQLDYLREHLDAIEAACHPHRVDISLDCLSAANRVAQLSGFIRLPPVDGE